MTTETTATKPPKKAKSSPKDYESPFAIAKKPDETGRLNVKDVLTLTKLQSRDGLSGGVDAERVKEFAAKMRGDPERGIKPEKFPPIKVMVVTDAPGYKDKPTNVVWDGFHTLEASALAGLKEVDCLIWKGTFDQAVAAAATLANREHDNSGKPRTVKDKLRAVRMLADTFKNSDVPKAQWPSNRWLAEQVGVSHQYVNDLDPFERKGSDGDHHARVTQQKRMNGHAGKSGTIPPEKTPAQVKAEFDAQMKAYEFEVQQTGQGLTPFDVVINGGERRKVYAKDEEGARSVMEKNSTAKVKGLASVQKANLLSKPVWIETEATGGAPTNGTPRKVGFDWQLIESQLGSLVRGIDAIGDLFGVKETAEWRHAQQATEPIAKAIRIFREKFSKTKSSS